MLLHECTAGCNQTWWKLTMNWTDFSALRFRNGTSVSNDDCRTACLANATCNAYDWYKDMCWISLPCGPLTCDLGNYHYDLENICSTQTTAVRNDCSAQATTVDIGRTTAPTSASSDFSINMWILCIACLF